MQKDWRGIVHTEAQEFIQVKRGVFINDISEIKTQNILDEISKIYISAA